MNVNILDICSQLKFWKICHFAILILKPFCTLIEKIKLMKCFQTMLSSLKQENVRVKCLNDEINVKISEEFVSFDKCQIKTPLI